jgi:hypothetical protein
VVEENLDDRPPGLGARLFDAREGRRLENPHADDQADADEENADQKRDAPAPRQKLCFRQARELGEHRG